VLLNEGVGDGGAAVTFALAVHGEAGVQGRAEGIARPIRATRSASRPGFWLDGDDGSLWWWPDGGAAVSVADPADASGDGAEGSTAWRLGTPGGPAFRVESEPNPEEPVLQVPTRAYLRVAALGDDHAPSAKVTPVATTPCRQRVACRLYGESYLVTTYQTGSDSEAASWGVYAFWSWTGELGVFAAPALRDDGSVAAP
jgi:hypothetical protein